MIGKRQRRELGDIEGLAANIRDVGLLHPVVITPGYHLIAGERRILACQLLKRDSIPVTIVDLDKSARGEHAENTYRKDFTLSEAVAIKRALEPLIRTEAKERMRSLGRAKRGAKLAPHVKDKARD